MAMLAVDLEAAPETFRTRAFAMDLNCGWTLLFEHALGHGSNGHAVLLVVLKPHKIQQLQDGDVELVVLVYPKAGTEAPFKSVLSS